MNRVFADKLFSTARTEDQKAGYAGLELWTQSGGKSEKLASVIFWDASGHWSVETYGEVPLEILEQCVAEAKTCFPTR